MAWLKRVSTGPVWLALLLLGTIDSMVDPWADSKGWSVLISIALALIFLGALEDRIRQEIKRETQQETKEAIEEARKAIEEARPAPVRDARFPL
jgi:hypothetical protein